jgi:hypothetical protein
MLPAQRQMVWWYNVCLCNDRYFILELHYTCHIQQSNCVLESVPIKSLTLSLQPFKCKVCAAVQSTAKFRSLLQDSIFPFRWAGRTLVGQRCSVHWLRHQTAKKIGILIANYCCVVSNSVEVCVNTSCVFIHNYRTKVRTSPLTRLIQDLLADAPEHAMRLRFLDLYSNAI